MLLWKRSSRRGLFPWSNSAEFSRYCDNIFETLVVKEKQIEQAGCASDVAARLGLRPLDQQRWHCNSSSEPEVPFPQVWRGSELC